MATLSDLKLELWLRRRNSGELTWTTRNGDKIPIKNMSDEHIRRAIAMIERNNLDNLDHDDIREDYESWYWDNLIE